MSDIGNQAVAKSPIALIHIRGGAVAVVDAAEYERLSTIKWSLAGSSTRKYASSRAGYMHRLVIGASPGEFVDHVNGDPLDNRLANLRLCTQSQNHANRKGTNSKSGFKGVKFAHGTWRAKVALKSGEIHVGAYASASDAARAYDNKMRELFGDFAQTNFPDIQPTPPTYRERLASTRVCDSCGVALGFQGRGQPKRYCSERCKAKVIRRRS
jgi:hypothetical protein